ncbi:hypothetical protein [Marinobacterium mangrovicola]|uniref:Tetratricopeptide repeat protein n=1 Tax=Marinobacterium mangrovicola TaxID=1476959 RepID=A0A4R1GQ80_9GAMM|nr:hypothetical protein [Marinobacterium mangrovicola]TCK09165.1 hypothetical protein CLV83_1269 [Marinobacterium mangrovicola]
MNWKEAARLGQQAFRDNQYRQAIAHHRKARDLALQEFEQLAVQQPDPAVAAVMVCEINLAESFVALEEWSACNACFESAERFLDDATGLLMDTGLEACLRGAAFIRQERCLLCQTYPQLTQASKASALSSTDLLSLHSRPGPIAGHLKKGLH